MSFYESEKKSPPPATRLLLFLTFAFISFVLVLTLIHFVGKPLFGIDEQTLATITQHLDNPDILHAAQLFQFVSSLCMFVLPAILLSLYLRTRIDDMLLLRSVPRAEIFFFSFLLMFTALPFVNYLMEWNSGLHLPAGLSELEQLMKSAEKEAEVLTEKFLQADDIPALLLNLLLIALIPAVAEEVFFRGVLQRAFHELSRNIHFAVIISSILFSAIHFQFYGFVPRVVMGMMLGYLYAWSNSLWLPIFAHFINNGSAVIASYLAQHQYISKEAEAGQLPGNPFPYVIASAVVSGFLLWKISQCCIKKQESL